MRSLHGRSSQHQNLRFFLSVYNSRFLLLTLHFEIISNYRKVTRIVLYIELWCTLHLGSPFVYISAHLPGHSVLFLICPPTYSSVHLSIHPLVHLSIHPVTHPSTRPPTHLSIHPSIRLISRLKTVCPLTHPQILVFPKNRTFYIATVYPSKSRS